MFGFLLVTVSCELAGTLVSPKSSARMETRLSVRADMFVESYEIYALPKLGEFLTRFATRPQLSLTRLSTARGTVFQYQFLDYFAEFYM